MPSVQKTQKQVAVARLSELSVDLSERLLPDQLKKKKNFYRIFFIEHHEIS